MSGTVMRLRLVENTSEPPTDDLVGEWVGFMRASGYTAATIRTRTHALESLLGFARVAHPLAIERHHVVAWLGRDMKPWTRCTYYAAVRAWCQFLREFGHSDIDLLQGVPRPKTPDPVARPVTEATVTALLNAPLPKRTHAYVRLALYQALRVHEIAKLKGEDFDLEHGWLTVCGKGGTHANIPIHPKVAALAEGFPEIGYWFPSGLGHVRAEAVSTSIAGALRAVGSTATAHQLRDTAATRLQRQQHDIRVTQALLRHRSIRSTMKYTQVSDEDLQAAVRGIAWGDT